VDELGDFPEGSGGINIRVHRYGISREDACGWWEVEGTKVIDEILGILEVGGLCTGYNL